MRIFLLYLAKIDSVMQSSPSNCSCVPQYIICIIKRNTKLIILVNVQITGRRSTKRCRIRTLKSVLKQCSCRTACTCVKTSPAILSPSTLKHAPVSSAPNTRHTMTSRSVNRQMLLQWIDISSEVGIQELPILKSDNHQQIYNILQIAISAFSSRTQLKAVTSLLLSTLTSLTRRHLLL